MTDVTLELARKLIHHALDEATRLGAAVAVSIVDAGGRAVSLVRMDGAPHLMAELAAGKAECAVGMGMPTGELQDLARPDAALYGVNTLLGGRVLVMGGGFPLHRGGRLVGAIGVSGGTTAQDEQIAVAALDQWQGTA